MFPVSHAQQIAHLLRDHAGPLELYAAQWTGDPEDCVQEAFVQLARQTQMPAKPVAWLYRVVRNRAFNKIRSAKRRTSHEQMAARLVRNSSIVPAIDSLILAEALEQISDEQRELLILRIWSEMTWSDIASLTNTSSSAAHRNYLSALKILKPHLDPTCQKNSH